MSVNAAVLHEQESQMNPIARALAHAAIARRHRAAWRKYLARKQA